MHDFCDLLNRVTEPLRAEQAEKAAEKEEAEAAVRTETEEPTAALPQREPDRQEA